MTTFNTPTPTRLAIHRMQAGCAERQAAGRWAVFTLAGVVHNRIMQHGIRLGLLPRPAIALCPAFSRACQRAGVVPARWLWACRSRSKAGGGRLARRD